MTIRIGNYVITNIVGGVAVYFGEITSPAHAVRFFATTDEARRWVEGRPRRTAVGRH